MILVEQHRFPGVLFNMSPEALDAEFTRDPFVPLRVYLNDGTSFEILDPALAVISKLVLYYFNPIKPNSHRSVSQTIVSLRNISKIEVLGSANAA
jgi:hypothetical protein